MSIFRKLRKNPEPPPPAPVAPAIAPKIEEEITPELVAVITAAVCAASGGGTNLVVRNIVRVPDSGSNWNRLHLGDRISTNWRAST